jgi:hypothetical protein
MACGKVAYSAYWPHPTACYGRKFAGVLCTRLSRGAQHHAEKTSFADGFNLKGWLESAVVRCMRSYKVIQLL